MCGRYPTAALSWAEIHAQLSFFADWSAPAEDPPARYNIAPTQFAPIVVARGAHGGEGLMARWDFVPRFHKGSLETKKWSGFNAKLETCATSPAYRAAVRERRCLVPTRGFYEWKREGQGKRPFLFAPAGGGVAFFAGLWDSWAGVHKGAPAAFVSFTVVTCPPNPLVAEVHDRMPVMLLPEDFKTWLFGAPEEALAVAGAYPAQMLRAVAVSAEVGAVRNDHPGLMEPLSAPGLAP